MQYSFLAQLIRFQLHLVGGVIVFNKDFQNNNKNDADYNINNNNDVIIIIIIIVCTVVIRL